MEIRIVQLLTLGARRSNLAVKMFIRGLLYLVYLIKKNEKNSSSGY